MACNFTIHEHDRHLGWDNSTSPVFSVRPRETMLVEAIDASSGHLYAKAGLDDLNALDFSTVNPVTGPIHIDRAELIDAVNISFNAFHPTGETDGGGWAANIPGFGFLSDEICDAGDLRVSKAVDMPNWVVSYNFPKSVLG